MSNYSKSTDFASKDTLSPGDPNKIVKGTEIDAEFEAIETAISSKVNTADIGVTVQAYDADLTTLGAGGSSARSFLGLAIGTNVQAWDADLDTWAGKTAPSGTVVGTTDTQTLTNKTINASQLVDASITAAKLDGAQSGSAPIYAARAWVNFNGTGTVAIRASGNVSSITDNGDGDYTINFTTAMPDANYAALCTTETDSTGDGHYMAMTYYSGRATGSVRVVDKYSSNASSYDVAYYGVVVFR